MEENLVKSFIGKNSDVIYSKMNKKFSFSVYSMLFNFLYFIYRKMYLVGILSFILQSIITQFINNALISILLLIIWGFLFYPLYKWHVDRKIKRIDLNTITEEELKKKGGTSIVPVIIIPLILIVILIISMGLMIFNTASDIDNTYNNNSYTEQENLNNYNSTNYFYSNGLTLTYGTDWKSAYIENGNEVFEVLTTDSKDIVLTCTVTGDASDDILDCTKSEDRVSLYNELANYYNLSAYQDYNGSLVNQSLEFKYLSNNIYYAYFDIISSANIYCRYIVLIDLSDQYVSYLTVRTDNAITISQEEKIIKLLKTADF